MKNKQCMSVQDMYKTLIQDGIVESNSPKNRLKLYQLLDSSKINYSKTTIGYSPSYKFISRLSGGRLSKWNAAQIIKWISTGKLPREEIKKGCDLYNTIFTHTFDSKYHANISDIEFVFDKKLTNRIKTLMLEEKWGHILDCKKCPFDYCSLKKPIVRIQLTN
ncbi:hypothetical protein ma275 [Moumouvirus australiensis]|uniref:Uncharacterized protein n=1 Tax=Moumouvirus australiensis TaxID=2109587 RepID=A0A2P1EL94_9VIRU|nr:hypothetical protein QKC55_gp629 [Moumouvirus australiensis]AVL94661.1 hypothetical protein ma275 [Moumouvirus australiensis]